MMPFMNPRILVLGLDADEDYLRTYTGAVRASGGEPDRCWPEPLIRKDDALLYGFLATYSGVVLPGGEDVNPRLYGEKPRPESDPPNAALDEGQLAAARVLLRSRIPVLAVCRGMQVLGVAAGLGLIQDLPSQRPSTITHNIKDPKDFLAHEVEAVEDSRLAVLCGATRFAVNSRHHQAVRDDSRGAVGPFRITVRAADGVPEAMECDSHPFLIAVQWHPENLVYGNAPARGLFHGFIEAARERSSV
jgi:putative glutamine amidotransferase